MHDLDRAVFVANFGYDPTISVEFESHIDLKENKKEVPTEDQKTFHHLLEQVKRCVTKTFDQTISPRETIGKDTGSCDLCNWMESSASSYAFPVPVTRSNLDDNNNPPEEGQEEVVADWWELSAYTYRLSAQFIHNVNDHNAPVPTSLLAVMRTLIVVVSTCKKDDKGRYFLPPEEDAAADEKKEGVRRLAPDRDDGPMKQCLLCGQLCTAKCSRCQAVPYCSTACSEKDWKRHAASCGSADGRQVVYDFLMEKAKKATRISATPDAKGRVALYTGFMSKEGETALLAQPWLQQQAYRTRRNADMAFWLASINQLKTKHFPSYCRETIEGFILLCPLGCDCRLQQSYFSVEFKNNQGADCIIHVNDSYLHAIYDHYIHPCPVAYNVIKQVYSEFHASFLHESCARLVAIRTNWLSGLTGFDCDGVRQALCDGMLSMDVVYRGIEVAYRFGAADCSDADFCRFFLPITQHCVPFPTAVTKQECKNEETVAILVDRSVLLGWTDFEFLSFVCRVVDSLFDSPYEYETNQELMLQWAHEGKIMAPRQDSDSYWTESLADKKGYSFLRATEEKKSPFRHLDEETEAQYISLLHEESTLSNAASLPETFAALSLQNKST